MGFAAYDALHMASAESAGADVLLTTDDQLLRCARGTAERLFVRVLNPVEWVREGVE